MPAVIVSNCLERDITTMHTRYLLAWFVYFTSVQVVAAQSLHTSGNVFRRAELLSCDNANLRFQQAPIEVGESGKSLTCRIQDLAAWGEIPIRKPRPYLWLRDGSWLAGQPYYFEGKWIIAGESKWQAELKPTAIAGCVLNAPANPHAFVRLISQMQTASGDQDWLWLKDGTTLAGLLKLSAGPSAELQITLTSGETTEQISASRVRAFVFSPSLSGATDLPQLRSAIGLSDGSVIAVRSLEAALQRTEHSQLQRSETLEMRGGQQLQFAFSAGESLVEQCVFFQQNSERWMWLSAVSPAAYRHTGLGSIQWQPGVGRTTNREFFWVQSGICCNMLALRPSSQIAFEVPRTATRFLAEVSLESSTAKAKVPAKRAVGTAKFEVMGVVDGQLVTLHSSDIAEGERLPVSVDIQASPLVAIVFRRKQSYASELVCRFPRVMHTAKSSGVE